MRKILTSSAILECQPHRKALAAIHRMRSRRPALAAIRAPSKRWVEEQIVGNYSFPWPSLQQRRIGLGLAVVAVVDK